LSTTLSCSRADFILLLFGHHWWCNRAHRNEVDLPRIEATFAAYPNVKKRYLGLSIVRGTADWTQHADKKGALARAKSAVTRPVPCLRHNDTNKATGRHAQEHTIPPGQRHTAQANRPYCHPRSRKRPVHCLLSLEQLL